MKSDRDAKANDDDGDHRRRSAPKKHKQRRRQRGKDDNDDPSASSDEDSISDTSSREGRRDRKRRKRSKERGTSRSGRDRDHRSNREKDRTKRRRDEKKKKKKRSRRRSSSSEESSSYSASSSEGSSSESSERRTATKAVVAVVPNERLLAKLQARGETLEERRERRAQKRAAYISSKFGYTPDDNPFHDPNLHEAFEWKKRKETASGRSKAAVASASVASAPKVTRDDTLLEIEKVRQRRKERELQFAEMERIRAEESRLKELEQYDDWARKEEEFHLQQQRQRSAIRLVEGREKPVDVLAKNILLFGLTDEEKRNRATVKYKERFNALEALENLEAELEEPQRLLKILKLEELEELLSDIDAFLALEREAFVSDAGTGSDVNSNPVLRYWYALHVVASDEVKFLRSGGAGGSHAQVVKDVQKIFHGQTQESLMEMQRDVRDRIRQYTASGTLDVGAFDADYWKAVDQQLTVYLAKLDLRDIHNHMLVRQLERLEQRKEELAKRPYRDEHEEANASAVQTENPLQPSEAGQEQGDLLEEAELGAADEIEIDLPTGKKFSWQDKYRPRKPRYFNRVKTGYDWNRYNQSHYDKDNPPPKVVQGYKFNIFYPDLIDPTRTPQFFLEPAASDEFCIIRFHAGPPYEDVAFKIVNREWNKSRKHGYKCTFERGVLSLYFNFTTHWYRR